MMAWKAGDTKEAPLQKAKITFQLLHELGSHTWKVEKALTR